jgi:hypothetical protein
MALAYGSLGIASGLAVPVDGILATSPPATGSLPIGRMGARGLTFTWGHVVNLAAAESGVDVNDLIGDLQPLGLQVASGSGTATAVLTAGGVGGDPGLIYRYGIPADAFVPGPAAKEVTVAVQGAVLITIITAQATPPPIRGGSGGSGGSGLILLVGACGVIILLLYLAARARGRKPAPTRALRGPKENGPRAPGPRAPGPRAPASSSGFLETLAGLDTAGLVLPW